MHLAAICDERVSLTAIRVVELIVTVRNTLRRAQRVLFSGKLTGFGLNPHQNRYTHCNKGQTEYLAHI